MDKVLKFVDAIAMPVVLTLFGVPAFGALGLIVYAVAHAN